jgi:hypothetical protein
MVALSEEEGYMLLEYESSNDAKCPLCKGDARPDKGAALTWNTQAKKFLWADLIF